jgi:hypothetical protein
MSIDALLARMEALGEPLDDGVDARRFFHFTYLRTTRAVAEALRAGVFVDPDWVERWDVAFADLYLDALEADRDGRPVPAPWQIAFEAARSDHQPPLRHVLLGMNAHINFDLSQALVAVINDEDFDDPAVLARRHADHRGIDRVLAARVGSEDAELSDLMPPTRVDRLLRPLNQLGTKRFLKESRAKVWANAHALHRARRAGPEAYDRRLRELERLCAARLAALQAPGPVLLRLATRGFGVRLPEVAPGP